MTRAKVPPGARIGGAKNDTIVFREGRPGAGVWEAPRDVKAMGPRATHEWNVKHDNGQRAARLARASNGLDETLRLETARKAAVDAHPAVISARAELAKTTAALNDAGRANDIKAMRVHREANNAANRAHAEAIRAAEAAHSSNVAPKTVTATPGAPKMVTSKPKAVTPKRAAAMKSYQDAFGVAPPAKMSAKAMASKIEIQAASHQRFMNERAAMRRASMPSAYQPAPAPNAAPVQSRMSRAAGYAAPALVGLSVGTAAVQGFHRAKDGGASTGEAIASGAANAALPAFVAFNKPIAKAAGATAETMFSISQYMLNQSDVFDLVILNAMHAKAGLLTGLAGTAAAGVQKVAQVAGKFLVPAAAAAGAVMGATRDENRLRGAGRGAVSSFDPTALVMKRGVAERAYDAVFGEADRPRSWTGTINRDTGDGSHRGQGAIRSKRGGQSGSWDDSNAGQTTNPSGSTTTNFASANKGFSVANAAFSGMKSAPSQELSNSKRGWANASTQAAAQAAKGRTFSGVFKDGIA